jgi:hypothetical protein
MIRGIVGLMLVSAAAAFSQAIVVVSPNGGGSFSAGQKVGVQWTGGPSITRVMIELSLDNGTTWSYIGSSAAGAGPFQWNVPYLKLGSERALIRVTADDVSNPPFDVSDGAFTIFPAAPDAYEPNNDMAHAWPVEMGDSVVKNAVATGNPASGDTSSCDADFYKVSLSAGTLVTLSAFVWHAADSGGDTGNLYPEITFYNPEGTQLAMGSPITYNVSRTGNYYVRIFPANAYSAIAWSRYGLSLRTITVLATQTSSISSDSVLQVTDSTYSVRVIADTTNLSINLTLASQVGGWLSTATLAAHEFLAVPGTDEKIAALSIKADSLLSKSIRSADIFIPYSVADLNGVPETSLVVLWLNDSASRWSPMAYTIDTVNKNIIVHTPHFSVYGVFVKSATRAFTAEKRATCYALHAAFARGTKRLAVSYAVPSRTDLEIRLYNLKGACVKFRSVAVSGASTVVVDCGDVRSGMYILTLRAAGYHVKRVVRMVR